MPSTKRSRNRRTRRSGGRQQRRSGSSRPVDNAARRQAELARQQAEQRRQQARRRRQRLILGAVVGGLVLVIIAAGIGIQSWLSGRSPQPPQTAQPGFGPVTIADGEPIMLGEQDAPVTVGLYEDFKCPHCADLEETLGATITDLLRDGSIRLALYPMAVVSPDGASAATANAMACAAADGFGTGYHAGLFANTRLGWSDEQLIELGRLVGEPSGEFASCIRQDRYAGWVDSIAGVAADAGVTGTPAVFIDGTKKSGATEWTPDQFRDQIQAAT